MYIKQHTKIGYVGLGNMGSRIAKNLHQAGFQIIGNDIVQEKCNAFTNIGAKATLDTNQVVKECEILMTSLRSSDILVQVEVIGDPQYIVYCGPCGSGQIVKGELLMGLSAAAYIKAMAYGVCAGVDPKAIRQAVVWEMDGVVSLTE